MIATLLCLLLVLCGLAPGASAAVSAQPPETVLSLSAYDGMFQLYDDNRTRGIGNYVTVDFVLTAYSLVMHDLLTTVEAEVLSPAFREMITALGTALTQPGPRSEGHTMALAYVSVIARLFDPEAALPQEVAPKVQAELALIEAHQGITPSAITGVLEDFSQYVPRGHYTTSEALQRYFQALLYAGRVGFFLRDSDATGVSTALAEEHTAAALRLSQTIMGEASLRRLYEQVQHLLDVFVGPSDDLTPADYVTMADTLPAAQARQQLLAMLIHTGRLPRILSNVVDKAKLDPKVTVAEVVAGFRLIPQRYTPDAEALQRLTYDHVTAYHGTGTPLTLSIINGKPVRGLPSVLDVMAGLGSQKAAQLLTSRGDTAYDGYAEQVAAVTTLLRQHTADPASLSSLHLRLARTLLEAPEAAARLNAALGFWISTRHLLLLYTKQSYTVAERSLRISPTRTAAAIEPAVAVYDALLATLTHVTKALEGHTASAQLTRFTEVVQRLRTLASTAQSDGGRLRESEDIAYVNDVDRRLKALVTTTDTPLVVDVHTEPSSQRVLEAGLGTPLVVAIGQESALRGARFHCYEFTHPLAQRLTDTAWQALLKAGQAQGSLSTTLLPAARQ